MDNPERERLREFWGCDAPTETPQFSAKCPFCKGKRVKCPHCDGTGDIDFHRCPHSYVGAREHEICQAVVMMESGILPHPGGWTDQAATFVDAAMLVASERAHYLNEQVGGS